MKQLVSVVVPTYNEVENVELLVQAIEKVFDEKLPEYNYEIDFIDNSSVDGTRDVITRLCQNDKKIKAIFNARNFGHIRSPFHGLREAQGDCVICMCADFQDPPEMIETFVRKWEEGYKIVIGIKNKSREGKLMYFVRSMYYKFIRKVGDVEQIEHFTGFGLYDKSFIEVLRQLEDPYPYMRGIVAELGFRRAEILFTQPKRERGKTKNNFFTLYDMAMLGITSYSKIVLRMATMLGMGIAVLSLLVAVLYFILKLVFWASIPMGIAPIIISIFFFGSVQLFFIGILGEYVLNINTKVLKRPLVVEEKRINYDKQDIL